MIAECADQGQEEGSEPRAPQPEKKGSGAGQLLTTLTVLAFLGALPRRLRMEGAACGRQGGLPQGAGGEGWCCLDPALASALPLASPLSGFPGREHRYSCGCIPCPPPHLCVTHSRREPSTVQEEQERLGSMPLPTGLLAAGSSEHKASLQTQLHHWMAVAQSTTQGSWPAGAGPPTPTPRALGVLPVPDLRTPSKGPQLVSQAPGKDAAPQTNLVPELPSAALLSNPDFPGTGTTPPGSRAAPLGRPQPSLEHQGRLGRARRERWPVHPKLRARRPSSFHVVWEEPAPLDGPCQRRTRGETSEEL